MSKVSKNYKKALEKIERTKKYSIEEALKILKSLPKLKFNETVNLSLNMGVDPKKSDQMIRSACVLPNGSGKDVKVLVFAEGEKAESAKEAGADIIGYQDLIKKITEGFLDFDVAISTPEAMVEVRKVGRTLGPRGLMPNPKTGTVTNDIEKAVKEAKAGRIDIKIDKSANIAVLVGKKDFSEKNLQENIIALINHLKKIKPSSAKGTYIKNIVLSTTMSPGIKIDNAIFAD